MKEHHLQLLNLTIHRHESIYWILKEGNDIIKLNSIIFLSICPKFVSTLKSHFSLSERLIKYVFFYFYKFLLRKATGVADTRTGKKKKEIKRCLTKKRKRNLDIFSRQYKPGQRQYKPAGGNVFLPLYLFLQTAHFCHSGVNVDNRFVFNLASPVGISQCIDGLFHV